MLEGLVARILNSFLGKYVQEFDAEAFNVGIFGGDVCLTGLHLKSSCLYELALPVEVGCGIIGELKIVIPWSCLSAKPILVTLEDLLIVAYPMGLLPFDEERDRQMKRALKRLVVDRIDAECGPSIQALLQAITPTLFYTVQIHVRNVHIRFEDPSSGVAAGIFIQEFSVETTNSKWKPVNQQSGSTTYQLLRVEALSVYLNAGLNRNQILIDDNAWVQHMRMAMLQFQIKDCPLDFVVKPLNSKLKVIVGRGERRNDTPVLVDVVVQDAVVAFSHRQVSALTSVVELFRRIPLYRDYLALRPGHPVTGHAAAWWLYSYAATLHQRVYPYTWTRFFALRRNYHDYTELYKKTLLKPVDLELRLDLQLAEDKLPLTCIVIAREHAKLEVKKEMRNELEVAEPKKGLSSPSAKSIEENPSSFIEYKLNVTIDNLSVSLMQNGREVLAVGLTQCLCSVESRVNDAWKVSARAGNIIVEGASPDFDLVPLLSTNVNLFSGTSAFTCFSLDVEKKYEADNEMVDHYVSIKIMPLEFIYNEYAFSELLSWAPKWEWGQALSGWWRKISNVASRCFTCAPWLDFHATIALPRIILPESGSLQKGGLVVIIELGNWEVKTELQPRLNMCEVAEMTLMELEERLYHRLLVQCTGLQILFTDSGEEWRELARRDESEAHVVSLARGSVVFSFSIKQEYRLLPRVKLNVGVPTLHMTLSDKRSQQLLDVLEKIPRPSAHYVMFVTQSPLFPDDKVPPEPTLYQLTALARKVVAYELFRNRTPDSLTSPCPAESGLDLSESAGLGARSVVSDTSDEELELWARTLDLPGFEDNVSPHNAISVLLHFTVGELVVNLPRNLGFQDKPYLMVRMARVCLDVAAMQCGPAVQVALGGLQLIDKLHTGPNGEYLEVLSTQSDQDFFTLLYRKVRADCPDFKSHFHGVEESLVIDVGHLSLVLQRDACLAINKFLQDFMNRIEERSVWQQLSLTGICFYKAQAMWRRCMKSTWGETPQPPLPPGGTKHSYSARMMELHVRLREAEVDFLHIHVGGLEGDWVLRANERLMLRLFLQRLNVEDLGETTLYPHIITQDEDYALELKLVRLSPSARHGLSHGTLKVNFARLHVLLASHIVHTLQRFVDLISWALYATVRQFCGRWLAELLSLWDGTLQLFLTLHLPTILLPPSPKAPALLIINLGDLSVENYLKDDDSGNRFDNILARLENAFVRRGLMTLAGSLESREEVLEPLLITLDAKRALSGIPVLDVVGSVNMLRLAIGQRDLALLIDVYASIGCLASAFSVSDLWTRGEEPVELRSLQAFLRDGHSQRRDSSFRFSLDACTVSLYSDMDEQLSSPVRELTHALCKFQMQDATISVETRASGVCELRCSVHNFILDDVRSEAGVIVSRLFGPRPGGDGRLDSAISVSSPPLIDIIGKQSERGDRCVDVLIEKTRLSLSASFMAALAKFFCDATPVSRDEGCDNLGYVGDVAPKSKTDSACCSEHVNETLVSRERGLSLSLQWRRPEVALVGDGAVGLVARCELLLDWSRCPGRDELVLRLAGLRVSSIQPAPLVVRPYDVEVVRNVKNGGVQIKVVVSPIDITLCSAAFNACSTLVEELQVAMKDPRELSQSVKSNILHTDDLWSAKKMATTCEASLSVPMAEPPSSELHSFPAGSPAESLQVAIGKIKVVLGLQKETTCRPLFIIKAELKLQAQDWSSAPGLTGECEIEAACWNNLLETWEPLLEPWEISLELYQSKALPISPCGPRSPYVRRSQDAAPPAVSSDSSEDESEPGMTFLRPDHFHLGRDVHRLSEGPSDCCDSEGEEGTLERLRGSVADMFVDVEGSSCGEESSEEVETESASSETCRSPATERAVFLNKHADSVDSGLETEAVDRQATYVLIQSSRRFEVSVTSNTLAAASLLVTQPLSTSPRLLSNYLGPGSVVILLEEGNVVATCAYDDDSRPSTPGSGPPSPSPSRTYSSIESTETFSADLTYPRENLEELKQRISGTQLTLQLPGLDSLLVSVGKCVGVQRLTMSPPRHGVSYTVVVSTMRTDNFTHYIVTGPLQIKNETAYAMGVYYKKSALITLGETILGESSNPFDEMVRLAVVAPDDCSYVPLTISCHCKLHFLPTYLPNHAISEEGVHWQEVSTSLDGQRDVVCTASDGSIFSFRACWSARPVCPRVLRLTSPWLLRNILPCACEVSLPCGQRMRLEAGEERNVYSLNPRQTSTIDIQVPEYLGITWSGTLILSPDCKEKMVPLSADLDTDGGNKQLTINVLVTHTFTSILLLYAPYWLLNKTGLPLQIRGSGSDIVQELVGDMPYYFSYRKQRARTVRLRVLTSSWSSTFSLDSTGCNGLVVCRDRERKKRYYVVVQCKPTHIQPALCRVVTFLPHLIVENAFKKHLRFMEDNEKADLWHDIAPSQNLPFWPDTDSNRMVVRLRDSMNVSPAFPVTSPHVTALRMDKGCTLTVEVVGGDGNPLRVVFRPYRPGDAPVRIDNHCADIFLKLRQKDCPQVVLLSPYHSLLYTWDDACKERELLWSVYNNAGRELCAHLMRDGHGEERVSFRSVRTRPARPQSSESSASSDSDHDPAAATTVLKETRKDTVVVYWTSFIQGQQRVLLLMQDERSARRARRIVEAERSNLELFIALPGGGLSLSNENTEGNMRELAYFSLNTAPALWELSVAHRWKSITADLAAWLENNYTNQAMQPKIRDLIHVDLAKMQMSKPLFGVLRRKQRPALWLQYRTSRHLSVLQMHLQIVQLDDQRALAVAPNVLRVSHKAGTGPALEVALLWRHGINTMDAVKFASLTVQEHCVHLDFDWLAEICTLAGRHWHQEESQSAMRRDITLLHSQASPLVAKPAVGENNDVLIVEQLHCLEVALDVTVVPSSPHVSPAALLRLTPRVCAGLVCSLASAPAPLTNLPIRLSGTEIVGGRWSFSQLKTHVLSHYLMQLLQQLHVLALGMHVLATPTAVFATRVPSATGPVTLPEEFSDTVSLEAETRMIARGSGACETDISLPREIWEACHSFPLGCALGLSGLAINLPRGPPCAGLDAFCRGPGRTIAGLIATLQGEDGGIPDPVNLLRDAIFRSTAMGESIVCRVRPPRYINPIMGLRPFSMVEAQGVALLDTLNRGQYNKDVYWCHAPLTAAHSPMLVVTLQRVLLVEQIGNTTMLNVTWSSNLDAVLSAVVENLSLVFTLRQGVELSERQITCWNPEVLNWLYVRLQEAMIAAKV